MKSILDKINKIDKIKTKRYYKNLLLIGLEDISTNRQLVNGTLKFRDTNISFSVFYSVYKSGYIRRHIIYPIKKESYYNK